ncbi:hypothetical protein [Streptomyces sp. NPDC056304]|uniref:hypothetical protein n=1 Tax=Streptomyces sp. NPDC056304 TaxID=3345778 RepID=UPI0035D734D1
MSHPPLDAAYMSLPSQAATACRRLALLPVKDVDVALAAAVCGGTHADVMDLLTALADAQLLTRADEQPGRGRVFVYHDEVLAHARATAPPESKREVVHLALEWLIATASTAEQLVTPSHAEFRRTYTAASQPVPLSFESEPEALAWLESQLPNLMTAVRAATRADLHSCVWQLVHAMWPAWRHFRRYQWWIEAHEAAVRSAQRCGEHAAGRELLNTLGLGYRHTGEHERALQAFRDVESMAEKADNTQMTAQSRHEQGVQYRELGRYPQSRRRLISARQMRVTAEDLRGVGLTDTELGRLDLACDDPASAASRLAKAHQALAEAGDPYDAARAKAWWSRAVAQCGDYSESLRLGKGAHEEFVACRAYMWAARTVEFLGLNAKEAGLPQEAANWFRQALAAYESLRSDSDVLRLRDRLADITGAAEQLFATEADFVESSPDRHRGYRALINPVDPNRKPTV